MADASGGIVGMVSGNMEDGIQDGAIMGAALYTLDFAVEWLSTHSKNMKALPEGHRNVAVEMIRIDEYFKRIENPHTETAKTVGIEGATLGLIGRPLIGDWSSILVGVLYGLGYSAYHYVKGHETVNKIRNYDISGK